jgi:hypothetical protein
MNKKTENYNHYGNEMQDKTGRALNHARREPQFGRGSSRKSTWQDNIKMGVTEDVEWIELCRDRVLR